MTEEQEQQQMNGEQLRAKIQEWCKRTGFPMAEMARRAQFATETFYAWHDQMHPNRKIIDRVQKVIKTSYTANEKKPLSASQQENAARQERRAALESVASLRDEIIAWHERTEISYLQLADAADVSAALVSRIVNKERHTQRPNTVKKLKRAMRELEAVATQEKKGEQ